MKKIVTERKNGTRRVAIKIEGKTLTDQSYKKDSDVNVLVARWKKTGVLAEKGQKQFIDLTQMPQSFEEAHAVVTGAWELFQDLPAAIRKAMGNDPANLEEFINDPKNTELLVDYGVLEKSALRATEKPAEASSEANPTSPTGENS